MKLPAYFRSNRLTIPLVIISLVMSIVLIFLFQTFIFRYVFKQSQEVLKRSFYIVGSRIDSEWKTKKVHFNNWFSSKETKTLMMQYLESEIKPSIKTNPVEKDRKFFLNGLAILLPIEAKLDFYLINPEGTIAFSSKGKLEGTPYTSMNFSNNNLIVQLLESINNQTPDDLYGIFFDTSLEDELNAIYIQAIIDPKNNETKGVILFHLKSNFISNNFSSIVDLDHRGEAYMINDRGFFISPSKNQGILLESLGVSTFEQSNEPEIIYRSLPIHNPGKNLNRKKISLDEYLEKPLTKMVDQLVLQPREPIFIERPYKNYIGNYVIGFGIWIESIKLGLIYEISFIKFLIVWIWIQVISILMILGFIFFFLSVAVFIDKHRLHALDSNPLTLLPGNQSIDEVINKLIISKKDLSVVYCDLDNFKAYNDRYGFVKGDKVIKFTGEVINRVLKKNRLDFKFIGHIGGDDFMFIVPQNDCKSIAGEIGQFFDREIVQFYNQEDLDRKGIVALERTGSEHFFPIMCLSMGGIHYHDHHFTHPMQLSSICADIKKLAKNQKGSVLVTERRKKDFDK